MSIELSVVTDWLGGAVPATARAWVEGCGIGLLSIAPHRKSETVSAKLRRRAY